MQICGHQQRIGIVICVYERHCTAVLPDLEPGYLIACFGVGEPDFQDNWLGRSRESRQCATHEVVASTVTTLETVSCHLPMSRSINTGSSRSQD